MAGVKMRGRAAPRRNRISTRHRRDAAQRKIGCRTILCSQGHCWSWAAASPFDALRRARRATSPVNDHIGEESARRGKLLLLHEAAEIERVGEAAIHISRIIRGDALERIAFIPRNVGADFAVFHAADPDTLFESGIGLVAGC